MIQDHHLYRLMDNGRALASAATLADCRSMSKHLFARSPTLRSIDVYAWSANTRDQGYSWALTLESSIQLAPKAA